MMSFSREAITYLSIILIDVALLAWIIVGVKTAWDERCFRPSPFEDLAIQVHRDLTQRWGDGATVMREGTRILVLSRQFVLRDGSTVRSGVRLVSDDIAFEREPYISDFDVLAPFGSTADLHVTQPIEMEIP